MYDTTVKIALVHELLTMRGGAERVLRVAAAMFPQAPIYTLLYDEKKMGDWFDPRRIRSSRLQRHAWLTTNHHLYLSSFPAAAEAWDFSAYDAVVSFSSAFAHGILTNGRPRHLCYVHSPARYLWDRTHDVLARAGGGPLGGLRQRHLSKTFHRLRVWDSEAADRADLLLAASQAVQRRIELYWRRESTVLHPPVDDFWLQKDLPSETRDARRETQDYFLVVSTLAPYKRINIAIDACNALRLPLVIAGEGPDRRRLEAMAGETIRFAGFQTDQALRTLYAGARAALFPGEEDFGLVPVESLACGTPVIAFSHGGARETLASETAEFFGEPTGASLGEAIKRFETRTFSADACRARAAGFSADRFRGGLSLALEKLMRID